MKTICSLSILLFPMFLLGQGILQSETTSSNHDDLISRIAILQAKIDSAMHDILLLSEKSSISCSRVPNDWNAPGSGGPNEVQTVSPSFFQSDSGMVCIGTTVTFTNTSTGGISYEWKVNGIFFESTQSINYTFADTGQFQITLVATDSSGTDSAIANFLVPSLPTTAPTVSGETCENFQDGSISLMTSGGIPPYSFQWSTGDSTGDISGLAPGEYSVIITDSIGCESVDTMVVENEGAVVADFTYGNDTNWHVIDFLDLSTNAVSWFWSFGDNETDTVQNPSHYYQFPGAHYEVWLIVESLFGCKDTAKLFVCPCGNLNIADDILHPLTVLPNPTTSQISLDLTSWLGREVDIQLIDLTGRVVQNTHLQAQTQIDLDISELATGIYSVLVEIDGKYLVGRLKKE